MSPARFIYADTASSTDHVCSLVEYCTDHSGDYALTDCTWIVPGTIIMDEEPLSWSIVPGDTDQ